MRRLVVLAATVLLFASLVPEDASAQRGRGIGMGGARVGGLGGWAALALALSGGLWVASAVLALARLAVGPALAGAAAPAWSVAPLLAPLWAGIRAGGFGAPLGAGIRAWGFGAPLGGAGIRAGGSDARPGGAHRSRSGSDLGPSPMGPVTDGTRIMGTTLTCATPRPTPATTATTNHQWPRLRGSKVARAPAERPTRAPSGPSFWVWNRPAVSFVDGGLDYSPPRGRAGAARPRGGFPLGVFAIWAAHFTTP